MESPSTAPIYHATITLPREALRAIFAFLPFQQASALKDADSLFYQPFARRCALIVEKSEREWDASRVVKHAKGSQILYRQYEFSRRIAIVRAASGGELVSYSRTFGEVYEWWYNGIWQYNDRLTYVTKVEHLREVYISAKAFLEDKCSVPEGES